jgi:hypothetical protein
LHVFDIWQNVELDKIAIAVRRPTLTIEVSLEKKIIWLSTGENIFLKILRRSEVSINFTRPLKELQASQLFPFMYYIVFFPGRI